MSAQHGIPCWYELSTTDPAAARDFYGAVVGWIFQDSGMPDVSYLLAAAPTAAWSPE